MKARRHCATLLQPSLISRRRSGFTLLQTLVSAVVGAILVVSIAQMTGTGLRTMREAGGRMVSAGKMHDLRGRLAADLDLVPRPGLASGPDQATLVLESDTGSSSLSLLIPDSTHSGWKRVNYRWDEKSGIVSRIEVPLSPVGQVQERQTLATGVQRWTLKCLASGGDTDGPAQWAGDNALPAALLCRVRLTSIREEGNPAFSRAATRDGRDYEWLLPLAGGGEP